MKTTLVIAVTVMVVVGCQAEKPVSAAPQQKLAATADGVRTVAIKVSGGEYQPASFNVKKGESVRLQFTRDEKATCGDVLVIPALKINEPIPVNKVVSVDITPDKTGDIEFTCGMNMMKGKIVVQ